MQIVRLVVNKQENQDHIFILEEQRKEFEGQVDSRMQGLEITAIEVKINYVRYKHNNLIFFVSLSNLSANKRITSFFV